MAGLAALMTLGTGLYIYLVTDSSLGQVVGFQIIAGAGVALLFQTPMLAIQNTESAGSLFQTYRPQKP